MLNTGFLILTGVLTLFPAAFAGVREKRAIRGGYVAKEGLYPYAVSVQIHGRQKEQCTGSLITPQSVFTAAHCVYRADGKIVDTRNVLAYVGSIHRTSRNILMFKQFRVHPSYVYPKRYNDLAILITVKPATLGDLVKLVPIGITTSRFTSCAIMGWGSTDISTKEPSELLHYAIVPVLSEEECKKYHIQSGEFCYGNAEVGSYVGDSGGPAVMRYNNKDVQIGMQISGKGNLPCAGLIVGTYKNWISQNAEGPVEFIILR